MHVCVRALKIIFPFLDTIVTCSMRPEETSIVASPKGIRSCICFNCTVTQTKQAEFMCDSNWFLHYNFHQHLWVYYMLLLFCTNLSFFNTHYHFSMFLISACFEFTVLLQISNWNRSFIEKVFRAVHFDFSFLTFRYLPYPIIYRYTSSFC